MEDRYYLPFVIMSLAFVPAPARFACAFVLVLELCLLVAAGTALKHLEVWSFLADYKTLLILTAVVAIVTLYSVIIGVWSPETQLQLGFMFYLQAASSFVISTIFGEDEAEKEVETDRWRSFKKTASFSVVILVLFAFREIAGFGTITYPTFGGVKEKVILKSAVRGMTLFATIPGALLCTALMLGGIALVERWQDIFCRAEGIND